MRKSTLRLYLLVTLICSTGIINVATYAQRQGLVLGLRLSRMGTYEEFHRGPRFEGFPTMSQSYSSTPTVTIVHGF